MTAKVLAWLRGQGMNRDELTGSRIRERRGIAGLRQVDLAKRVGISASYLNLIEHNRRRIGGKLLIDLARELGVDQAMLTEGAEAALLSALREASAEFTGIAAETDRAEDFASRFPGWAELLAAFLGRASALAETVRMLSDRLTHDPHLAASLHEVLSTAASIRSTAAILAEPGEIDRKWLKRFHRNIDKDARRLADSCKGLVSYLGEEGKGSDMPRLPLEEADAFFAAHDHHFPEIEDGSTSVTDLVEGSGELTNPSSRGLARRILEQIVRDSASLPRAAFMAAVRELGIDPPALARRLGGDLPTVFRRFAALPKGGLPVDPGLVICDASGSILYRRPVVGFALPQFGASCPLWPLFAALTRPLVPIRRRVSQLGRSEVPFDCMAIAWPREVSGFDEDPVYRSAMLIVPVVTDGDGIPARPVGSDCRVCPRSRCPVRREPSILGDRF